MFKLYDYSINEAPDALDALHGAKVDAKGALYDVLSCGETIVNPPTSREEAEKATFSRLVLNGEMNRPVVTPYFASEDIEVKYQSLEISVPAKQWEGEHGSRFAYNKAMSTFLGDGWRVGNLVSWGDITQVHLGGKLVVERATEEELETRFFVVNPRRPLPDWDEGFATEEEALQEATKRVENSLLREGRDVISLKRTKDGKPPVHVKYEVEQYRVTAHVMAYRPTSDEYPSVAGHIVCLNVVDSKESATRGSNA